MPTCVRACACACVVRARADGHTKSEHVLSAHRRDNDDEVENVPGPTEEAPPFGDQT